MLFEASEGGRGRGRYETQFRRRNGDLKLWSTELSGLEIVFPTLHSIRRDEVPSSVWLRRARWSCVLIVSPRRDADFVKQVVNLLRQIEVAVETAPAPPPPVNLGAEIAYSR